MHDSAAELRCQLPSKSRNRECRGFARYRCVNPECGARTCGTHVMRSPEAVRCPSCHASVRADALRTSHLAR